MHGDSDKDAEADEKKALKEFGLRVVCLAELCCLVAKDMGYQSNKYTHKKRLTPGKNTTKKKNTTCVFSSFWGKRGKRSFPSHDTDEIDHLQGRLIAVLGLGLDGASQTKLVGLIWEKGKTGFWSTAFWGLFFRIVDVMSVLE